MTAPVIIEDYDPSWPAQFEILRLPIARALGPLAAAIEHIGSTAVPGLAAKPIVDLDVLLNSKSKFEVVISRLVALGYEYRGDLGIVGREAFRAPAGGYPHHLYVCPADSFEFRRHIAFRDHLRSHPQDAEAYAELKRALAAKFPLDREAYSRAKTNFIEQILSTMPRAPTEQFP